MGNTSDKYVKDCKHLYDIFKSMSLDDLKHLANMSGLDMSHYTTKSLIAKGMMSRFELSLKEIENWA